MQAAITSIAIAFGVGMAGNCMRSAQSSNTAFARLYDAIAKNASFFNSHRMMRRYASDAYMR